MRQKAKHPITAKRNKSRGAVRGHLVRRNRALAEALAVGAVAHRDLRKDGALRIPFLQDVPGKVRKDAFAIAAAIIGQRGGEARAKKLTKKEQSNIGKRAAKARWEKARRP